MDGRGNRRQDEEMWRRSGKDWTKVRRASDDVGRFFVMVGQQGTASEDGRARREINRKREEEKGREDGREYYARRCGRQREPYPWGEFAGYTPR
ncbi:hypothetical protein JAAARDRAFT_32209 [Jaapia argillacea MUCL 33604]|uniref:Uncharacterized protein n=1 Tax=Jaapia argillacea MUCL 33604 TaxID=933084 RepID=A0A067Q4X4_9AGAM|nr:hypothetical protein JAAARDRAFT_32209 [Jaapia argillacea MUCL 33604]